MLRFLRLLIWLLSRAVLPLRYRVRVHGMDKVKALEGPILVLPNHPAYIDPPILLSTFYPVRNLRPLLYENNFQNPFLGGFLPLLNAIRVPDLDSASAEARLRAEQAIQLVIEALRKGDSVIFYPSGRIQRSNVESLGAARTLADVLAAVPNVNVIRVRTRGLWGSSYSYARTGQRPALARIVPKGLGLLLANLLFFTPRR